MYRPNNPRYNAPPGANQMHHDHDRKLNTRTPSHFRKEAPSVQSKDEVKQLKSALKPFGPEIKKWKSSFRETNEKDQESGDGRNTSPDRKRFQLYDPYENIKSDSEESLSAVQQKGSSTSRGRWDIDESQKQQISTKPPQPPSPHTAHAEIRRTGDCEDIDYRSQVTTTVGVSPSPPPLHSYKQTPGPSDPPQLPRPRQKVDPVRKEVVNHKNLISCDLCEVGLSNRQELEEHLDCKTHWDTLEYIQSQKNYDDMAMAFLQDVMMFKCRKSSRAIEDTALPALQEQDHMTRLEMFHCAACNAFVPTSASSVHDHISAQEHKANTKEFEVKQRQLCLQKAETMMTELRPQFMTFAKGGTPFD